MRRWPYPVILALVLALALAACGEDDPGPPPSVVITYEPQPIVTIVGGCDAEELEDWYEEANALIFAFADESEAGLDREQTDLPDVISRLSTLRSALSTQTVPECAAQTQTEILSVTQVTLTAYSRYMDGSATHDELAGRVRDVNRQIETRIAALLADMQAELERQIGDASP